MPTEADVREQLRQFIRIDLLHDPLFPFEDDEKIISKGPIDSFALSQIGVFAEQAFDVYIPDPDLTVTKMDTLDLMVARIMRDVK